MAACANRNLLRKISIFLTEKFPPLFHRQSSPQTIVWQPAFGFASPVLRNARRPSRRKSDHSSNRGRLCKLASACIASWVRTLTVATIVKAQNSGPSSRRPGTPCRALQHVGARKDDSESDSGMPAPQATARDTPPGSAAKKSSQSPTSRRPQVGGAEPGAGSPVRRIRRRLRRRP